MAQDFLTNPYPEKQAEVREMLDALRASLSSLDLDRIESHHRYGPKFTRVDDGVRVESERGRQIEVDAFGAAERFDSEFEDLRIDVFGTTALTTCVYKGEFEVNGQVTPFRVYLIFLLVSDGGEWKITHESLFRMPTE